MQIPKNSITLAYLLTSLGLFAVAIFLAFTEILGDCSVVTIHPFYTMFLLISLVPIPFIFCCQKFANLASIVTFAATLVTIIMLFINRNTVTFFLSEKKPEIKTPESLKSYITKNVSVVFYGDQKTFDKREESKSTDDDKKKFKKENDDLSEIEIKKIKQYVNEQVKQKKKPKTNEIPDSSKKDEKKPEVHTLVDIDFKFNLQYEDQFKTFVEYLNSYKYSHLGSNLLLLIKLDGCEKMKEAGFSRTFKSE